MVQTGYKEKALHRKDHQISENCPDKLCCCPPLEIFKTRLNKVLKTWSVLIVDHALCWRWTRCFPEVSSKLNFPMILQMRVTKARALTSELFLLPLPVFHEDKAFPSPTLLDYFEASSMGNLYVFSVDADAHDNSLVPLYECIFFHCPCQDKSHIGKI